MTNPYVSIPGVSKGTADSTYLRLDTTNSPLTGDLEIQGDLTIDTNLLVTDSIANTVSITGDIIVSSGGTLTVDTIAETTTDGGVSVDGVLLKDERVYVAPGGFIISEVTPGTDNRLLISYDISTNDALIRTRNGADNNWSTRLTIPGENNAGSAIWSNLTDVDFGTIPITADTINESTASSGVTVEGVLLKDSEVSLGVENRLWSNIAGILDNEIYLHTDAVGSSVNEMVLSAVARMTFIGDSNNNTTLGDIFAWYVDSTSVATGTNVMNLGEDGTLYVDTINELTNANGVVIDGATLKDGELIATDLTIDTNLLVTDSTLNTVSITGDIIVNSATSGTSIISVESNSQYELLTLQNTSTGNNARNRLVFDGATSAVDNTPEEKGRLDYVGPGVSTTVDGVDFGDSFYLVGTDVTHTGIYTTGAAEINLFTNDLQRLNINAGGDITHKGATNDSGFRFHFKGQSIGRTSIPQTHYGFLATSTGMNTSAKYTPGYMFGSEDPQFTTTPTKMLAGIVGYATETYAADDDGGMGISFFTSPNNPGATPTPTERVTIDNDGVLEAKHAVTLPYVAKTGAYTITYDDHTIDCTSGTFTVTLPTASGITGRIYNIKNSGTGTITIDGNGSETIDGQTTQLITEQYVSVTVQSNGTNWVII